MSYAPPAVIAQVFQADDPDWVQVLDNHRKVQEFYQPPILDQYLSFTSTSTTYADRVVWRVRDNHALHDVRVRVRARTTVGAGTLRVVTGAASADAAVSGAWAWYTLDVTPPAADGDYVLRAKVTTGGDLLEVGAIQVYLVPTAGTDATGWVDVDSGVWGAASAQIPSRVVQDLLNGSRFIANDRPYCMTSRVSDLSITVSAKTPEAWGAYDSTLYQSVGRLVRPYPLLYPEMRLDAYVTRSSGTAEVEIRVGAVVWQFSAASDGWYTTTVTGPDAIADVYAAIIPGSLAGAAIRTLQIWRGG